MKMNDKPIKPPSKLIKKLYSEFVKKHEAIMIELLGQAYKEGHDELLETYRSTIKDMQIHYESQLNPNENERTN